MHYQNNDLMINKFLVNHNEIITDISALKNKQLCRDIYFRPSNAPLVTVADADQGSCFEGYTIPTASFIYTKDSAGISYTKQATNLALSSYTDQVWNDINNTIKQIYQRHNEVTLCYSGGIDSMVLLSYIMAQGLLPRTNIICFENHTQDNELALHNNIENKEKVTGLLKKLESQVKSITWITITVDDIADSFNNGNLEHLKCYSTNSILQKYKDTAFIFGFHGNQVFLHKTVFVDELLLQGVIGIDEVERLLVTSTPFYTQSLLGYNIDKELVGVDRAHMLHKPWALLDHTNNNRVYSPIGSDLTFNLLRSLDFKTVSLNDVANVTVARGIINRNVTQELDDFIGVEGLYDNDILMDTMIPVSLLKQDLLVIPTELTHNQEGVDYINHELAQSKISGAIPINALVSIKMLGWIKQL